MDQVGNLGAKVWADCFWSLDARANMHVKVWQGDNSISESTTS